MDRHPVNRSGVIHPTDRLEQVAWQPDDHHRAEHGETDTEPEESVLTAIPCGVGQGGEGHAAVAAFGFLRRIGLLAIQASGHGSVLSSSLPACPALLLLELPELLLSDDEDALLSCKRRMRLAAFLT